MNKMQKGAWAEASFIQHAFRNGWEVAKPFHHSQGYDYVVRTSCSDGWKTVQVKAAYQGKQGTGKQVLEVSLRRSNEKGSHPYQAGDYDLLFVAGPQSNWLFTWDQIKKSRSVAQVGGPKYDSFRV